MPMQTILFDLDGTLLPMDQDVFVKTYFKGLAVKMAPFGFEPQKLIETIWAGTVAMVKNDGRQTNEAVFWDSFARTYGSDVRKYEPEFQSFYEHEFQNVKNVCGFTPDAATAVHKLKKMGFRVALATNPLFPSIATESRTRWAGLQPEDFALCTTYENSSYCKPNPKYYLEILDKLGCAPEECLMVGNDVSEDMVAKELGMQVFLLTACLINKENKDIRCYPHGDFADLLKYVETLK